MPDWDDRLKQLSPDSVASPAPPASSAHFETFQKPTRKPDAYMAAYAESDSVVSVHKNEPRVIRVWRLDNRRELGLIREFWFPSSAYYFNSIYYFDGIKNTRTICAVTKTGIYYLPVEEGTKTDISAFTSFLS